MRLPIPIPIQPVFVADADPVPTNPTLVDTDGDGLDDGVEDADLSGSVDSGETDPNNVDSDGDGCEDGMKSMAQHRPHQSRHRW